MIKGKIRISDPKTGELLHQQDMHSFVKNFIYYMFWNFALLEQATPGWLRSLTPIIGIGLDAEDVTQTSLSNELTTFEEDITYYTKTENTDNVTITISKVFTNLSGATETITEIGLENSVSDELYVRDLLTTSLTVNDHQGIEVTYEIVVGEPFTRNMGILTYARAKYVNSVLTSLTGETVTFSKYNTFYSYGILDDLTRNIVIGTDNTPMDFTDYCLGSQITSGWTCTGDDAFVNTTGNTTNGYITRSFMNRTGAAVTVNEVGFIANDSENYALLLRYLTGGITIEDGDRLQVVMKISTTM